MPQKELLPLQPRPLRLQRHAAWPQPAQRPCSAGAPGWASRREAPARRRESRIRRRAHTRSGPSARSSGGVSSAAPSRAAASPALGLASGASGSSGVGDWRGRVNCTPPQEATAAAARVVPRRCREAWQCSARGLRGLPSALSHAGPPLRCKSKRVTSEAGIKYNRATPTPLQASKWRLAAAWLRTAEGSRDQGGQEPHISLRDHNAQAKLSMIYLATSPRASAHHRCLDETQAQNWKLLPSVGSLCLPVSFTASLAEGAATPGLTKGSGRLARH